jgi:hypothetical protein
MRDKKISKLNFKEKNRASAFLKRIVTNKLFFNKFKTTSIKRLEEPLDIKSTKKKLYYQSFSIEVLDPRNGSLRSHSFNNRWCLEIQNIILEPRQGLIYSLDKKLIIESTCWSPLEVYRSYPWLPKNPSNYPVIEMGICLTSSSYYHWLIEDLPAVIFSMKCDPSSPLIVSNGSPGYVKEFAQNSGRKVIYVTGPQFVKKLVFVEKQNDSGWPSKPDVEEILNYPLFKKSISTEKNSKKYYISRRYSKRSPANEAEIEILSVEFGFEVLYLESISLAKQVNLISQASCLVGIHGAGHANMIWMKPGSKVVDIVNENYWTEANHRLANLKNQTYLPFLYKGEINNSINLEELSKFLKLLK